jgi:cobalt-precorrin-5B (C1)-methyltransferase
MNTTGYTLPVFACASAIAALRHLHQEQNIDTISVNLIKPRQIVEIPIEQVAKIDNNKAIAITRSDPGDHLDITRNTPIWALITSEKNTTSEKIKIEGGEGIGRQSGDRAAIYSYARELIVANLTPLLYLEESITVTIILPEGRKLAERTSNAAFGVVEGLSLLGTTGIVQPLVAPSQLEAYQTQLKERAASFDSLVFCIGENGLDLAQKSGIDPAKIVKTANWIGSMLVVAALAEVKSIVLFGYHGKLIKLAGGIFHTHNHLADARLEIFISYCVRVGLPPAQLQEILSCATTEDCLQLLRQWDLENNTNWEKQVYHAIARAIDRRCQDYIRKYTEKNLCIGSVLFDRQRQAIKKSDNAMFLLSDLC